MHWGRLLAMLKKAPWVVAALILVVLATSCAPSETPAPRAPTHDPNIAPPLDPVLVSQGEALYQTYCAACHGAELEGEANWGLPKEDGTLPAPPHDSSGHTWHHPDSLLFEIIIQGGNPALGGSMPGFGEALSQEEMEAILAFIKTYWDEDQRQVQWEISNISQGQ